MKIVESLKKNIPFLLGDGTGVGKGRVIAGIISELELDTLWISSSMKLETTARNELELVLENRPKKVRFSSYSAIRFKFKELLEYVSTQDTLIIIDECHQLRNCSKTKSIIDKLLKFTNKICYSSATIASSVKHLIYLEKLRIWGSTDSPFESWHQLENAAKSDGPALLELISLHLCRKGQYLCRQLDNQNISFEVKMAPMTPYYEQMYEKCAASFSNMDGKRRQHFFLRLIVLFKVKYTIQLITEYLKRGKSVIISVSNTGEASFKRAKENAQRSTSFVQEICDEYGIDSDFELEPIDIIIQHFGSNNVSEITGRTRRPIGRDKDSEKIPKTDIESFQKNEKKIAILSRAGGMGLSLHDPTGNCPRVHIILETPWGGEDFLQQMGRVYRSNAQSLPSYVFVISNVPSEYRLILSIIKKLKNMGAIVKADRSAYDIPGLKEENNWSARMKANVGLQLAIASRFSEVREITTPVNYEPTTHRTMISLQQCITKNLCFHEDEGDEVEENTAIWSYNLGLSRDFFPQLYYPVVEIWSPENHYLYGPAFKKRTLTLLMCSKVTPNTLGMLPGPVLLLIIEFMADVQGLSSLAEIARWTHIPYYKFSSSSSETIMNDALSMPISVQHSFLNLLNSSVHNVKTPNTVKTINQYACELAGSKYIETIVTNVETTEYKYASHKIRVKYVCIPKIEPPTNAEYWQSNNGRLVWTNSSGECYSLDGGNCLFDEHNFQSCSISKWERACERQVMRLQTICNQTPTQFYLATNNALPCWNVSLKRVVRFEDRNGINMVGLLVEILP
jgi:coenzyme F420-reducing hydrogenase delta subunit